MAKKASKALLALDDALATEMSKFYADPYGFVMFAFPWGERGTPLEHYTGPDSWQREQLQRIGERLTGDIDSIIYEAVASGHGIGKSAQTSFIILWAMSTRPHLNCVVTANTLNQLTTKTWRELAVWHKRLINAHWFEWTATKFMHRDHPETWFASATPNSEHNSEAFAGLHAEHVLIIFDEASAIPDAIWNVTMGAMTTPGAMWFVYGNPTRNSGRFRECFGSMKHRWNGQQIDSRTCSMTDKKQLNEWAADYGEESDFYRVRVRGQFPHAGEQQFISAEIVANAVAREVEVPKGAPKLMGVDVARFGTDSSVICRRHGRKAEQFLSFHGMDTMDLASRVAQEIELYKPDAVFIDGVGIGAGVVDRLRQLKYDVIEVQAGARPDPENVDKVVNKRAEMWMRTKEWLETADIPAEQQLIDDLTGIEYGFDARMRLQLEKKADMKKRGLASPDWAEALIMTFAYGTPPVSSMLIARESLVPDWVEDY